jgi:hypothetical protein
MDSQSTPIANLNNNHDDTQVVNQILDKYNTLQSGGGELPPLNPSIPNMEKQFDNRNLNSEVFSHSSQNVAYQNDYNNEVQRTKQFQQQQQMQQQQMQQQIPKGILKNTKRFGFQIQNKNIKNSVIVIVIFILLNSKMIWRALSKMPMMGTLEPSILALIVNSILAGIVFYIISSKFNKV